MKRQILSFTLLSSLLLTGCHNSSEKEPDTSEESEIGEITTSENSVEENVAEEVEQVEETEFLYTINPEVFSVVPLESEEETENKLVLLTFDDAPYGNTLEIADALEERGVSAIFFVNSMYMENEEGFEVIKELHERGFEIANHTHTHAKLNDYTEEDQYQEIVKTNELIEKATGTAPRFFRAPHGVMTDYSKELLDELGMTWMNWSFGYDWMSEYRDPSALAEITLTTPFLKNGANILMHDREWTAEATPAIVDGLIEQGFTIVDPKTIINKQNQN